MALYTDKDVSTILKRAAELQARTQGTAATGLTLEELQSIARDVGVDPQFVAQAAREAAHAPPADDDTFYFWGAPGRAQTDRVLPGEMTDDLWETIVREARRTFGQPGETSEVGRTREWRWSYAGYYTMAFLSASSRNGQTSIHAERRLDNEGAVAFLLPLLTTFVFGMLASLTMGLPALGISLVLFVLVFFGSRKLFKSLSRKARRQLDEMLARIEQMADVAAPTAVAQAAAAPRLTLPDEALPDAEAPDATRARTT